MPLRGERLLDELFGFLSENSSRDVEPRTGSLLEIIDHAEKHSGALEDTQGATVITWAATPIDQRERIICLFTEGSV